MKVYGYHPNTTEENKIIIGCSVLDHEDVGFTNADGECCSTIPANDSYISDYYSFSEEEHYYQSEWEDELNLYIKQSHALLMKTVGFTSL